MDFIYFLDLWCRRDETAREASLHDDIVPVRVALRISPVECLTRGQVGELLVNRHENVSFTVAFYLCDFVRKEWRLVLVFILVISFFRHLVYRDWPKQRLRRMIRRLSSGGKWRNWRRRMHKWNLSLSAWAGPFPSCSLHVINRMHSVKAWRMRGIMLDPML
jgi:hypothetical protein